MFTNRFSSSGLAGASVDARAERGIVSQVVYRPRYLNDPTPFLVQVVGEGVHVEQTVPESEQEEDGRAEGA